ncbi:uncharacterized protein JN550_010850 [Neoarthrinium moseri]|uniref:uncharacterized protein n=1 Tax=Neoarthrinium moseri TaxID=1658444 RepID=UPI001FDC6D9C|nr:uncharacterized protein JN550_010850 [Neoarthrinium moseri]KAI1861470.1 hypothetical protein JN550_010850 [Neoarthrinium moseri]
MAPNQVTIPRKPVPRPEPRNKRTVKRKSPRLTTLLSSAFAAILLFTVLPWARRWFLSGAAIQSFLLLFTHRGDDSAFPSIPLWTRLSTLNLIYAVCSTSWLLHGLFVSVCYPTILLTSLTHFPWVGELSRKLMRKTFGRYGHFIRDKLALFNLPALEIDTEVDGLFVLRGVTISFSTLSIVGHGVECGIKLAKDIELAIYVDEVVVNLFRRIEIGDVYANVKGGKFEMTFGGLDDDTTDDTASLDSFFVGDTPLLRAASAGTDGFKNRPKLRESLTGVSFMQDSSPRAGLDGVTRLSPDEDEAEKDYHELLTDIKTTSAIHKARRQALQKATEEQRSALDDVKNMRAAINAELHSFPSISHSPTRSVRVSMLRTMSPPWVREFQHRLPLLLRLLLAPVSYLHPIKISSINAAGSGKWVSSLLQHEIFAEHTETNAELRRLHRRTSAWLADTTFSLQLVDVDGLGQVPLSTYFDIVTYLKVHDVVAYRTVQEHGTIAQVVRVGGADATFRIPSYLLPHHEHCIPPEPSTEDKEQLEIDVTEADGIPQTVRAKKLLKKAQKDQTSIEMSVHAQLPATFDQSMLNFVAAVVKATKIIELEEEALDIDPESPPQPSPAPSPPPEADSTPPSSPVKASMGIKEAVNVKMLARNIRQNLKDGTYNSNIKDFVKEVHKNTRDGMRKHAVGTLINDRWIAKLVGKTAAALQKAQGDIGYTGGIPIPLAPYRGSKDLPTKLLP